MKQGYVSLIDGHVDEIQNDTISNYEKYANDIAKTKGEFGLDMNSMKPVSCMEIDCEECLFNVPDYECKNQRRKWGELRTNRLK